MYVCMYVIRNQCQVVLCSDRTHFSKMQRDLVSDDWAQFQITDSDDAAVTQIHHHVIESSVEPPITMERLQSLRQQANGLFAQQEYDAALGLYSEAIRQLQQGRQLEDGDDRDTQELHVILLCNRSACLFRMDMFLEAKEDAALAISISKSCTIFTIKAYFRLARALLALQEIHSAKETIDTALSLLSQNQSLHNHHEIQSTKLELETLGRKITQSIQDKQRHVKQSHTTPVQPTPSIRDYNILGEELGEGNYSSVVVVSHKDTQHKFALKIMNKSKAQQLHKRQHPNVFQEIAMEQRVLTQSDKLGRRADTTTSAQDSHKQQFIIHMMHAFQDYNNFYFIMELHNTCGDLWSTMRWTLQLGPASNTTTRTTKRYMVGTHASLVQIYLWEILSALEFIHARGIVHRDLKPENVLISNTGHVVLIDFGTAKDLIDTDLNGPEFVGTPEYMSPQVLQSSSHNTTPSSHSIPLEEANHTLDLWALGVMAFQLLSGTTPFASPSPFLTFLKIQRANLYRPMGIVHDDAWDLIQKLVQIDPHQRLGASCFQIDSTQHPPTVICSNTLQEYTPLRQHVYWKSLSTNFHRQDRLPRPIPSLRDLCIRACGILVQQDSYQVDLDTSHPPGDGSYHDMLRLNSNDRRSVMHLLDKLRLLSEPRIYRRFFRTKQEARLDKVRPWTCDYIGLTQMNDRQGQFPIRSNHKEDASRCMNPTTDWVDVGTTINPIRIIHVVSNPEMGRISSQPHTGLDLLKQTMKRLNQIRPKAVVVSGPMDEIRRKWWSKVNESIPLILNDGTYFFSFWVCGAQGLVLRSQEWMMIESDTMAQPQLQWLDQELEQSEMSQHPCFAFVDCVVDLVPSWLIQKLAKAKVQCLFGLSNADGEEVVKEYVYTVEENTNDDGSTSSEESMSHCMRIVGQRDLSLRSIELEDGGEWTLETL